MLLFAWSLVSSAVQYARRKRVLSLLRQHSDDNGYTAIVCRRIVDRFENGPVRMGHLRKAPSEPLLHRLAAEQELIFRAGDMEIVAVEIPVLRVEEWTSFFSESHRVLIGVDAQRVVFTVKVCFTGDWPAPSTSQADFLKLATAAEGVQDPKAEQRTANNYLVRLACNVITFNQVDQLANRIARKKDGFYEFLYEAEINNFFLLVLYAFEGILAAFNDYCRVVEISSVVLPSIESVLSTPARNNLAIYPSFTSLNASREDVVSYMHPKYGRPLHLLELLYMREHGMPIAELENHRGVGYRQRALCVSDTALNTKQAAWPERWNDGIGRTNRKETNLVCNQRHRSLSPSVASSLHRSGWLQSKSSLRRPPPPEAPLTTPFSTAVQIPFYLKRLRERGPDSRTSTTTSTLGNSSARKNPSSSSHEEITIQDSDSSLPNDDFSLTSFRSEAVREDYRQETRQQKKKIQPLQKGSAVNEDVARSRQRELIRPHNSVPISSFFWPPSRDFRRSKRRQPKIMSSSMSKEPEASEHGFEGSLTVENLVPRKRFNSLTPRPTFLPTADIVRTLVSDIVFRRRSSTSVSRRRFHTTSNGYSQMDDGENGVKSKKDADLESNTQCKPPSFLVYTGDKLDLFQRIHSSVKAILPQNIYTFTHLTTKALKSHPWMDGNALCLLVADTSLLDDASWAKLQSYFIHSGKIIFICQNSLCASLTNCDSVKRQISILKNAFGGKNSNDALGKNFEQFMKKAVKHLSKSKEVDEVYHAKDPVGGYKFSVVLKKKEDQPLFLYMENSEHQASALFSDVTTDELLSSAGRLLFKEAFSRLNIRLVDDENRLCPPYGIGYLVCADDKLVYDMTGLTYGEVMGTHPKLVFRPSVQIRDGHTLPQAADDLLPIEVRRRNDGVPDDNFNSTSYFSHLRTKSLGRSLIYLPVCESTINVVKSLSSILPHYDGLAVVSGFQTRGVGRGGNQWLSPKGCAMFTFDFNIPLESDLGRNVTFVQHIMAVAIVDAVLTLLDNPEFPLKIKWPNDIYYGRSYKMGGVLVTGSTQGSHMRCFISAGLNVANSHPTVCINDMIPMDSDKTLTVEKVLAEVMNKFEYYTNMFVKKGRREFLKFYHQFWLHSHEEVTVMHEETSSKERVVIRGLDDNGFLEVRSKQSGKVFSVYDNGNTFDMLKGLIHPKGW